jgi:hypothetical protein
MCSVLVSSSCLLLNDTNIMFWSLTRFCSKYVSTLFQNIQTIVFKCTIQTPHSLECSVRLSVLSSPIEWLPPVWHLVTCFTCACAMPWELSRVSSKTIDVIWLARYTTQMIKIQKNCRITNIQATQTLVAWCMYSNTHVCVWQSWGTSHY